jgi:hypothetical protein
MWSTKYGILQPLASLKTGLTRRNDGLGFYSNRAATVISRVTKIVSRELRLDCPPDASPRQAIRWLDDSLYWCGKTRPSLYPSYRAAAGSATTLKRVRMTFAIKHNNVVHERDLRPIGTRVAHHARHPTGLAVGAGRGGGQPLRRSAAREDPNGGRGMEDG